MYIREKSLEGYLSKLLTIVISRWWVCWWILVHSVDVYILYIFCNKYLFHIREEEKRCQQLQAISDGTRKEKAIAEQTHWNRPRLHHRLNRSSQGQRRCERVSASADVWEKACAEVPGCSEWREDAVSAGSSIRQVNLTGSAQRWGQGD